MLSSIRASSQKLVASAIRQNGRVTVLQSSAMAVAASVAGSPSPAFISTPMSQLPICHRQMSTSTGGTHIRTLVSENPHIDVVHYKFKNQKVTVQQVDYFSEALAIGLTENGLSTGDVVLSWLPQHFAEQMLLQFACSKAGLIHYWLDPSLVGEDDDLGKEQVIKALQVTKANVFVSQEAADETDFIKIAARAVPELERFNFDAGMPFITPRYPDLRFCIHSGFDNEDKLGWMALREMIVPSNNLESHIDMSLINDQTPLAGEIILGDDMIPIKTGKIFTNAEVIANKVWPTYCKILSTEYHVVEGKGAHW